MILDLTRITYFHKDINDCRLPFKLLYEYKNYINVDDFDIWTKSSFILHFHGQVSKGEPLTSTTT